VPKDARIFTSAAVWVAALGYFVDIYDLLLFSIVRVPSHQELGVAFIVFAITLWAAAGLRETFGRDLDFIEED
jgi:hypothetical protein